MRGGWSVAAGLAVLLVSSSAWSQVKRSERTTDGDFHEFRDDLMSGDVAFPGGGNIKVRPLPPMRALLIRPRTSFVPEMLKSVEFM